MINNTFVLVATYEAHDVDTMAQPETVIQ